MTISFPTNTVTTIDAIREAIGRDVTFNYVASVTECTLCTLNIVTGESTNPFCSGCGGSHYITVMSGYTVTAVITWSPADILNWSTAGKYYEGDVLIQTKRTTDLLSILDKVETIEVDGRTTEILNRTDRGVPSLNRIILELKELEKE